MSTQGSFEDCPQGTAICTLTCEPPNCPIKEEYSEGDIIHSIHTNGTIDLWGNTVVLFKTDREFSFNHSIKQENGECGGTKLSIDGTISEDLHSVTTVLYFLSTSEKVALYKRSTYSIKFNGSVGKIVGFFGELIQYYGIITLPIPQIERHEEIVLLIDKEELVLSSYKLEPTTQTGTWKTIAAPTPSPNAPLGKAGDEDVDKHMPYNQYPFCDEYVYGTLTDLDGGRDMFFPEWIREYIDDTQYEHERYWRVQGCLGISSSGETEFTPTIAVDPIPRGDFARHPELGDCYSWLISEFGDPIVVNYPPIVEGLIETATGQELKNSVAIYPISLL